MKNSIWKIATIISIIAVLLLFFVFLSQKKKYSYLESVYNQQYEYRDTLNFYKRNFDMNSEISGMRINNIKCNNKQQKYKIRDFISDKPLLVYRYTSSDCSSCVHAMVDSLNVNFSDFSEDLLILSSFENENDFYIFLKEEKILFPICLTDFRNFTWFPKTFGMGYFFLLTPDLNVSNFYMPDTMFPEISKDYLDRMKKIIENY
ncbi:hypothetical protein [Parabacteroides sp. AM08-6]|uniref:hypothetical protein n=1 Tax=Parabacteroides sp. AM08-6 TaxID=2292053 RepID=UPI000EFE023F|nr:hypothetical protein [Parabacteroides sp. AM08-6]RHJ85324.1 hypothetical protein DW103_03745 [Parabacteroides sp. AM08-6]